MIEFTDPPNQTEPVEGFWWLVGETATRLLISVVIASVLFFIIAVFAYALYTLGELLGMFYGLIVLAVGLWVFLVRYVYQSL
jgi:uncharacterized RDD family membrane protein YckC